MRSWEGAWNTKETASEDAFYAVGHSNQSLEQFLHVVRGMTTLADVRTARGSRRVPWTNPDSLSTALADVGIVYHALPALGGFRRRTGDPRNAGWTHPAFHAYADYALTDEFRAGMDELLSLPRPCVFMCAEAVWWRCHRRILADYLLVKGFPVIHLPFGKPHTLTAFARPSAEGILYPPSPGGAQ